MYLFRILVVITSISLFIAQLTAQTATPRPISGGPVGASGAPVTSPTVSTGSSTPIYAGDAAHPMFITGKVILQDGSAPPQPALIERICTGQAHPEGYTDSKGTFSIRLGQELEVTPDASETPDRNTATRANPSGGIKDSQLVNCDLRFVLNGFRSELVSLSNRKYMDNPDIGTVLLHPQSSVEGLTLSATTALAPKDAGKAYQRGLDALKKNKADDAEKEFEKAVDLYPKFAAAWFELGRVHERFAHMEEARYAYTQSIAADSKFVFPYERLYLLGFKESKWKEVADNSDRVQRLDPMDYPAAYYYNAIANLQLNNLEAAEKSARQSVTLDTKGANPQGMYVLGVILARKKDYTGAAENLRAYLKAAPDGKEAGDARKHLADLDRMLASAAPPQK
jgi:tetratricopeptide (TPR) repeat protein